MRFLDNLGALSIAVGLRRLTPMPIDVRKTATTLAWIWPGAHGALRGELRRVREALSSQCSGE